MAVQVLFVIAQEASLLKVLEVAHGQDLINGDYILGLFAFFFLVLNETSQLGLLPPVLDPAKYKEEGDSISHLPIKLILHLSLAYIPQIVVLLSCPLLLSEAIVLLQVRQDAIILVSKGGKLFPLLVAVFEEILEYASLELFEFIPLPSLGEKVARSEHGGLEDRGVRHDLHDARVEYAPRYKVVDLIRVASTYSTS